MEEWENFMFKILVVEDDRDLNRTVCTFLNHSGCEAVGCLNAEEAYDAMYENLSDLIVSDIMMPGIDGFEFAQNVRQLNDNIPILFMTAKDDIASSLKLEIGKFVMDVDEFVAELDGEEINLTKREFNILYKLYPIQRKLLPDSSSWMNFGTQIRKQHRER